MAELSYSHAPVPVRDEIVLAHRYAWVRLGQPGTWWTGRERLAIAAETRNASGCPLCRERKAALSPSAVEGKHQSLGILSDPVVDLVHRIRTDSGRLTENWYEEIIASGLTDAHYVEAVGVIVSVVSLDTFARSIGIPAPELPAPVEGEPSRVRPDSAKADRAWLPMIAPEDAAGAEADLYGDAPMVPNIQRALTLVPAEARTFQKLGTVHYFSFEEMADITKGKAIDRGQIELLAARVSVLNQCFY